MADCDETIRELDAFLDGELPDAVREHIDAHLGGCLDCLQAAEFQTELRAAVRRKCSTDEMPPTLLARLRVCLDTAFEDFDPESDAGS
jgi:anti-sigma factor (TIGR02949 family)